MHTETNNKESFFSKYPDDNTLLEKIINDYPYSSVTRFFLLLNYKKNKNENFDKSIKQTALYFNNTNWLRFKLDKMVLEKFDQPSKESLDTPDHFAIVIPEFEKNTDDIIDTDVVKEEVSKESEEKIIIANEEGILELEEGEPAIIDENTEPENDREKKIFSNKGEEITNGAEVEKTKGFDDEQETEEINEIKENNFRENDNQNQKLTNTQEEDIKDEKKSIAAEETKIFAGPDSETDDQVSFEPLHTIDYFASQGIKINPESLMNDKLGKQMKSFTDWLKSMKKLHPGKLPEQNEVIEKLIQTSAEESNEAAEVLTEAMAEVLLKQDKREKAIEMYQKLSLIYPSKSTYFAAKIESIKHN
ncbi:MAG: hypothetical protein ABI172_12740 [Ginsengibacter sp.]|jgi:hypothetical protein